MADYNIYIHSDNPENASQTKPRTTDEEKGANDFYGQVNKVIGTISNPDSIISSGVAFAMKSFPAVACAYAALKVSENVVATIESFRSIQSGNYRYETEFNNFKTSFHAMFRPFSTILNAERFSLQNKVNNDRLNQYRELFGDSEINSYGRGV